VGIDVLVLRAQANASMPASYLFIYLLLFNRRTERPLTLSVKAESEKHM